MNNSENDKRIALGKLNKAMLEAISLGLRISVAPMYNSINTRWAIIIEENVSFSGLGMMLEEVDEQ